MFFFEKITLENFGPHNRTRIIGKSMYRISRQHDDSGKWYIYEGYCNTELGLDCRGASGYYSDDLQTVIDVLNSLTSEKEIIKEFGE